MVRDAKSPSNDVDTGLLSAWMCLFGAVIRNEDWPLAEVRLMTNVVFDYWETEGLPKSKDSSQAIEHGSNQL